MKEKKLFVLSLILVCFLLGSSSGLFAQGQDESVSSDKIIIETFSDLFPEYWMEALEEKGLADKVELRMVPQNQYENKIRMMLAGGEVGDIICIDAPNIGYYAEMNALEPLDAYWDRDDFDDLVGSAQEAMQWQGNIWASPLNEANCVLYYNREMFKEAGIVAPTTYEDAWSLDELLEAAIKLTKRDKNGNVEVYGLFPQMFSVDNRNEGMTFTQMLWTWWYGSEIISPDGTTVDGYFNSPESKAALQFYADLFNKYEVAPSISMNNPLASERVAMYINGPWMVGTWQNNFPEFFDGKWGAMPLPKGAAEASNSGSWNLAITRQSKNKDLAWEVVSAITDTEGSYIYCSNTGNLPARESTLAISDMSQPPYDIIKDQLIHSAKSRPVTPVYPKISEALMDAYNAVAFGESVDVAFEEAVQKMNAALQ
ncbi:ABC transporter substrate-binding protein [Pleomorphochaeta sp. DL1XJH-081]|uniref:ABC transporter substrate-binding protein n=1 Tax=Pleomorphochaeta sp. DL1XJH-081 TaxID=3409690 RepID=UPI003BB4A7A1